MTSRSSSFKRIDSDIVVNSMSHISLPEPAILYSPRSISKLDAAAVMIQKVYKGYLTRRNLADCAVVVEELWLKALEYAARKRRSVALKNFVTCDSTFDINIGEARYSDHSKDIGVVRVDSATTS